MVRVRAYSFGAGADHGEVSAKARMLAPRAVVQVFRKDAASNLFVVEMLAAQTLAAAKSGSLLARTPEMDLLLRVAGTTQIGEALRRAGARRGEEFVLVVAGGLGRPPGPPGGRPVHGGRRSEEDFLRIERAALLSARRS